MRAGLFFRLWENLLLFGRDCWFCFVFNSALHLQMTTAAPCQDKLSGLNHPLLCISSGMKTPLGVELKGLGFLLKSWWCLYKRDIQEWIQFVLYEVLVLTSGRFSLQVLLSPHQKSIVANWKSLLFCEY